MLKLKMFWIKQEGLHRVSELSKKVHSKHIVPPKNWITRMVELAVNYSFIHFIFLTDNVHNSQLAVESLEEIPRCIHETSNQLWRLRFGCQDSETISKHAKANYVDDDFQGNIVKPVDLMDVGSHLSRKNGTGRKAEKIVLLPLPKCSSLT